MTRWSTPFSMPLHRHRHGQLALAELLAAIQVARIAARGESLDVTAVPAQLVRDAGDVVLATVRRAGALDEHHPSRPQHRLVGLAVDLADCRNEPAGFVAHRLGDG